MERINFQVTGRYFEPVERGSRKGFRLGRSYTGWMLHESRCDSKVYYFSSNIMIDAKRGCESDAFSGQIGQTSRIGFFCMFLSFRLCVISHGSCMGMERHSMSVSVTCYRNFREDGSYFTA